MNKPEYKIFVDLKSNTFLRSKNEQKGKHILDQRQNPSFQWHFRVTTIRAVNELGKNGSIDQQIIQIGAPLQTGVVWKSANDVFATYRPVAAADVSAASSIVRFSSFFLFRATTASVVDARLFFIFLFDSLSDFQFCDVFRGFRADCAFKVYLLFYFPSNNVSYSILSFFTPFYLSLSEIIYLSLVKYLIYYISLEQLERNYGSHTIFDHRLLFAYETNNTSHKFSVTSIIPSTTVC